METKIVLALAVVALSIGCCAGKGGTIHGVRYQELFDHAKVDRRLTSGTELNAREVADLLTVAKDKFTPLESSKGVNIFDLLNLVSQYKYCSLQSFTKFENWHKLFSGPDGNANMFTYVDENMKRLFEECADDIDALFKSEALAVGPGVRHLSDRISKYTVSRGEKDDPRDKTVSDVLIDGKILSGKEKQQLIEGCAELVPRVEKSLGYFMKNAKKISDYLGNLGDTEQALLYKRCKIVNQMFFKQ